MRALSTAVAVLLMPIANATMLLAQDRDFGSNANTCLVWTSESLLANAYYQVAKNDCSYPIRIEYRYEEDTGAGCFGSSPCTALLQPHEIRRFATGTIRHWACRPPAVPHFPNIAHDGSCE